MLNWSDFRLPPINLWSFPLFKKEKQKISIRIDPISATIRFYKQPVEHLPIQEMREQYYRTMVCQFLDNGEVRISAIVEAPTLGEIKILRKELKEMGVCFGDMET